jgi:pimeloyl-ACP methyl ester carboxylesterase
VPSSGSLVYLHGGQTRHSWACTCRRLALTGWDGLGYDARGHGDSGWDVDADYGIDAFIGDLRRVISASSDVPVLVGASMGGMAALIAQGEDATTSRELVLVDVVPSFESRGSSEVFEFLNSGINGFADIQDAVEAIKAYDPTRGAMIGDRIERVLRWRCDRWYWRWDPNLVADPADIAARASTATDATPGTPVNADLDRLQARARIAATKITVPVLLLRGAQSPTIDSACVAQRHCRRRSCDHRNRQRRAVRRARRLSKLTGSCAATDKGAGGGQSDLDGSTQEGQELALILIHGGAHTAACWEPTRQRLNAAPPRTPVIAVELPGCGADAKDMTALRTSDFVNAVVETVERSGCETVILVGHSMAGLTVPRVAAACT